MLFKELSCIRSCQTLFLYFSLQGVTEGYNGTIFAYGQTGSGKSFTMQGVSDPTAQRGVIPRAFEHIFESIQVDEKIYIFSNTKINNTVQEMNVRYNII